MEHPALRSCDLHVHSVHSTDSGNYALRRARVGESYTQPKRLYETCLRRGMSFVTISDHNTLEGALRIADRPNAFLSVEVTTRFPEDDVPLHVLVWNVSEEDHRDLQPYRASVYELVDFLRERCLAHALAHPLYRMGAPLTRSHVERMMLLFSVWEGRNGARPESSNTLAVALAESVTPALVERFAGVHGIEPRHTGRIALSAGSDDHGALDIATTFTQVEAATVEGFLDGVVSGRGTIVGEHGSSVKLAHAVGALVLNAYRSSGRALSPPVEMHVASLFDGRDDGPERHDRIVAATSLVARALSDGARRGALDIDALPTVGHRLGSLLLAGALEAPFIGAVRHHAETRVGVRELQRELQGEPSRFGGPAGEPRALVFTDTFGETNGVAGTMRRLATAAQQGDLQLQVVTCGAAHAGGVASFPPDWSFPVPGYETLDMRVPSLTQVLAFVEREQPDTIHVATPGPVGLCGLAAARALGVPLVGSYHTELGPYALHLTRDLLVAEAFDRYVEWFYRQCVLVLGPTSAVADALVQKGMTASVWGRGVDTARFTPDRRDEALRSRLLGGGDLLLLFVGRLSVEKRLHVLLRAFEAVRAAVPGARLVLAGDGPSRSHFEDEAPEGTTFLGELHGERLAALYASADVFCFPSTTDTFGQVILEAGASGLPLVAAAAGGALELVEDRRTGLLVTPDDVTALAAAIRELASAPARRELLGTAARDAALDRSWQRSFDELARAYRAVTGRPSHAAGRRIAA
jgi:glycosyltransferase involved in cell wall biosynthesis